MSGGKNTLEYVPKGRGLSNKTCSLSVNVPSGVGLWFVQSMFKQSVKPPPLEELEFDWVFVGRCEGCQLEINIDLQVRGVCVRTNNVNNYIGS